MLPHLDYKVPERTISSASNEILALLNLALRQIAGVLLVFDNTESKHVKVVMKI